MDTYLSLAQLTQPFGPAAVTIGKFDGVHTGHLAVIDQLTGIAADRDLTSVAVTFDRNPLGLFAPERCPTALVSNAQRLELLGATGLDATVMFEFDRAFAAKTPEEFVGEVLVEGLGAKAVLVGPDFKFGAKGAGTVAALVDFGARFGFDVVAIDEFDVDDRRVSSTWIRELLAGGDVEGATRLLGRLPSLRAEVVHGEHRGRELGYPTANLAREVEGFIPLDGVYAAWLVVDGEQYGAAVSIGNNPTFDGVPAHQIEAHAFDQSFDLYARVVELRLAHYVRGMRKFSGADELAAQMRDDERRIRELLELQAPAE